MVANLFSSVFSVPITAVVIAFLVGSACSSADMAALKKADSPAVSRISAKPGSFAVLSVGNQQMWVEKKDDGVQIAAFLDTLAQRDLLSAEDQSIFQLEFDSSGQKIGLRSDYGWKKTSISSSSKKLTITLSGRNEPPLEKFKAVITARASADNRAILWRLKLDGVGELASVRQIRFPQIVLAADKGYWNIFFPVASGVVHSGEALKSFSMGGGYPDGWSTMQYMALYDIRSGFYFACHDPYASYKIIHAKGSPEGSVRMFFEQYAPNMTVPGNGYESDFDAAWEIYKGDWYDAAMLYKKWASKEAKWFNRKGQERTPATPDKMLELSSWTTRGGGAQECVDVVKKFAEYMGVPTAFHWYSWHVIPFDNDYPHYFPTKPGVAEGVKELQEAGISVMPYINGRLWDTKDKGAEDWQFSSVALPGTTKGEDGAPYIETYGSKEEDGSDVKLSIMCPTSNIWHDKVSEIVLRLMNEVGVNGVYIDQIAAAPPRLCMDKTHGHPLGGGHWWTEAYWELVQKIRENIPIGHYLTTECNADPYIRWFDGYLTWHWQEKNMVPAFCAVYGGTIAMFGRSYGGDAAAVKAKAAQQLVFGEQIGWCGPDIINDKAKGEYLRSAIRMRNQFTKVISHGEMLRPLALSCDAAPVTSDWQWYGVRMVTTDPVLTGSWREGKKIVMLFANITDKQVTSRFRIDAKDYNLPSKFRVNIYNSDEKIGEKDLTLSTLQQIDLAPNQIAAWEVVK